MSDDIRNLAMAFLDACKARNIMAATAESCTGGMIAAALTDVAGSSAVIDRGFVTYSNEAKMDMLGVSAHTLQTHGAVSKATVMEMATGALANSPAGIVLAVTGIAGPDGGSPDKPVGLVWFGVARTGHATLVESRQYGAIGRDQVRRATVIDAVRLGLAALEA